MKKIYSKITNQLLHVIVHVSDFDYTRKDVSPNEEILQVSFFALPENKTFQAHKHVILERETDTTQESWVVISGRIRVFHYDLDDTIISEEDIGPGECTITFAGGHNYLSLEENTRVYEFKNGPYFGRDKDKVNI